MMKYERGKESKKKYKFVLEYLIFEILFGYGLTLGLMKLNSVVYFPFFEALCVLIISVST